MKNPPLQVKRFEGGVIVSSVKATQLRIDTPSGTLRKRLDLKEDSRIVCDDIEFWYHKPTGSTYRLPVTIEKVNSSNQINLDEFSHVIKRNLICTTCAGFSIARICISILLLVT